MTSLGDIGISLGYVDNKDCSEYAEDVISLVGGELYTLMFFCTRGSMPSYFDAYNRHTAVWEKYYYHTLCKTRYGFIDYISSYTAIDTLAEVVENMNRSANILLVVKGTWNPPLLTLDKMVEMLNRIGNEYSIMEVSDNGTVQQTSYF